MMDFKQTAYHTLKCLRSDTDFQDLTLCIEDGQSIKAHKVVLSSFSPVFRNILKKNPHPHPLLFMSNVTMNELSSILTFIYLGEAQIPVGEYNRFIEVAKRFKINGIAELDALKEYQELESFSCALKENKNRESFISNQISDIKVEDCKTDQENMNDTLPRITQIKSDVISSEDFASKRKYKCDECDYAATQSSSLKVHVESKHRGIRYPCQLCSYKGTTKGNTKVHMKVKHSM